MGIFTSIVAWGLLWRWLSPRGHFSAVVCQDGNDPINYRVKFLNAGRRRLSDVQFRAYMFLPGQHALGGSQPLIAIPMLEGEFPIMGGRLQKGAASRGVLELPHRTLLLRPDLIPDAQLQRLPEQIQHMLGRGTLGALRETMECLPGSRLYVVCNASDAGTGARRSLLSRAYAADSIVPGRFDRGPTLNWMSAAELRRDSGGSPSGSDHEGS